MKPSIPDLERLIFALDVADAAAARKLVEQLGEAVQFYKIGLELFMGGEYFPLLDWLVARHKRVFVDLKFFDVPATVAAAVRQLRNRGVTFTTVHGNQSIMEAAAEAKGDVKVLGVTVLTSLDRGDLDDLGFKCDVEQLVLSRARRALEAGCDGVVSSGLEAQLLRAPAGDHSGYPAGRESSQRRPETGRISRAGPSVRGRLHRRGAPDSRCRRPQGRRRADPGADRRGQADARQGRLIARAGVRRWFINHLRLIKTTG
jgi:orotidine 5'-phosphate decarboxylase subfamily 1